MNNWYAIETESAFRQREWQRETAHDLKVAQAEALAPRRSWTGVPQLVLARLRGWTASHRPFTPAIQAECRTAICL